MFAVRGVGMIPATFQAYRAALDAHDASLARELLGALILQWEHLVSRPAKRLARGDYDDMMQVGRMALVKAITKYDVTRGPFPVFARIRINDALDVEVVSRRAIVPAAPRWGQSDTSNSLRRMPQSVRKQERAFVARTGRLPSHEELGVSAADLETWRAKTVALEYCEEPERGFEAVLAASVWYARNAFSRKVRETLGAMPPQTQRIVYLRVLEDLDIVAISEQEGLERGVTTRIYNRALKKLRAAVGEADSCT